MLGTLLVGFRTPVDGIKTTSDPLPPRVCLNKSKQNDEKKELLKPTLRGCTCGCGSPTLVEALPSRRLFLGLDNLKSRSVVAHLAPNNTGLRQRQARTKLDRRGLPN